VPHATRDERLSRLVQVHARAHARTHARTVYDCSLHHIWLQAHEDASGGSSRPKRSRVARDLERDAEDYVRRTGCHNSLPTGNVACHLHEAMRRSGEFKHIDPGPEKSD